MGKIAKGIAQKRQFNEIREDYGYYREIAIITRAKEGESFEITIMGNTQMVTKIKGLHSDKTAQKFGYGQDGDEVVLKFSDNSVAHYRYSSYYHGYKYVDNKIRMNKKKKLAEIKERNKNEWANASEMSLMV